MFVYRTECGLTFSICKVGDCVLQTYQTVTKLKRATTLEFTIISPILYMQCYALFVSFPLSYTLESVYLSNFLIVLMLIPL